MIIIINKRDIMKKTIIISYLFLVAFVSSLFANEVNIFSARHYDSDVQLYEKFTAKTGIRVNVVSGKSGATNSRFRAPQQPCQVL